MNLKDLVNYARVQAGFIPREEAWKKGICARCQKPPLFYSQNGKKEYGITGLCEYCFDAVTKDPDEPSSGEIKMTEENKEEIIEQIRQVPVPPTELSDEELEELHNPKEDEDEETEDENGDKKN